MNTHLAGKHIAITRPVEQAKKLADLITNAGGTPILFPLIEITPLADYSLFDATISQIEDYDWAIFISSNAVQNGMPRLLKKDIPKNLKFAAIGPVTAAELKDFGAEQVLTPQGRFDSEALLALPEMQAMQNKKVMIFRGVGGREILAESLKTHGATVTFAECYQRTNPQQNCDGLKANKLHGIVVTSSEAMRHLLDLAGNEDWLKNTPIFVNHARVAEQVLARGLTVHIAETGGDEAMLKCIGKATDNETQAIERGTAEGFLEHYNAKYNTTFSIVKIAGNGESPDVECRDLAGKQLYIEVTMTEDNVGDIQAALGRSEHKSLDALRGQLQKVRAGTAQLPVTCLSENVVGILIQRIQKKLQKHYGDNVALVVRETTGVDWDWDLEQVKIRTALKSEINHFDKGVWLLSRSKERIFQIL